MTLQVSDEFAKFCESLPPVLLKKCSFHDLRLLWNWFEGEKKIWAISAGLIKSFNEQEKEAGRDE